MVFYLFPPGPPDWPSSAHRSDYTQPNERTGLWTTTTKKDLICTNENSFDSLPSNNPISISFIRSVLSKPFFFFFFSFSVCSPSDWGSQCCSAKLDWRGFMVYKDKKDRGGRECDTVWRQKKKKKNTKPALCGVEIEIGVVAQTSQFDYFSVPFQQIVTSSIWFFYIFIIKLSLSLSLLITD